MNVGFAPHEPAAGVDAFAVGGYSEAGGGEAKGRHFRC